MNTRPVLDRFMDKIEIKPNGCWEWTGSLSTNGYGFINVNHKSVRAHRFSVVEIASLQVVEIPSATIRILQVF